jgi:cation diffusion facilitator family transporter
MSSGSTKAVLAALGANTGIAIAKTAGAFFTGSGSLMAESLHSWADCSNQILLLIGMKQAKREPDINHPMGYSKVSYFYTMTVAILLFLLGGVFSVYEGAERILHPHPVEYLGISIMVLLVAVGLESFSLMGALKGMKEERGDQSLFTWFKTTRQSELLVVTAEDIGALSGLAVALVFMILTWITGNVLFDAIGSLLIGVLMIAISFLVLVEVKAMITGESVGEKKEAQIREFLLAQPEIEEVYNIIAMQWGNDMMVATKAKIKATTADELVINIDAVEERLQKEFSIRWSFFEPDNR